MLRFATADDATCFRIRDVSRARYSRYRYRFRFRPRTCCLASSTLHDDRDPDCAQSGEPSSAAIVPRRFFNRAIKDPLRKPTPGDHQAFPHNRKTGPWFYRTDCLVAAAEVIASARALLPFAFASPTPITTAASPVTAPTSMASATSMFSATSLFSATSITTTTTTGSRFTRPGLVDHKLSATEIDLVQRFDCSITFRVIFHFDKTETAWTTCLPIFDQVHSGNRTVFREECLDFVGGARKGNIPNVDVFHVLITGFFNPYRFQLYPLSGFLQILMKLPATFCFGHVSGPNDKIPQSLIGIPVISVVLQNRSQQIGNFHILD